MPFAFLSVLDSKAFLSVLDSSPDSIPVYEATTIGQEDGLRVPGTPLEATVQPVQPAGTCSPAFTLRAR